MSKFYRLVKIQAVDRTGKAREWNEELDISFKVERDDSGTPNKAECSIFNLNEDSLSWLNRDELTVRIFAGYRGLRDERTEDDYKLLFQGDMFDFEVDPDKTDVKTTILCGDGQKKFQNATVSKSFRGGDVSFVDMIKETGKKLGETVDIKGAIKDVKAGEFSLAGSASKVMDGLTKSTDSSWSVQSGRVEVVPAGEPRTRTAKVLKASTGLEKVKATDSGFKLYSMLYPELVPRDLVSVESRRTTGFYVVSSVKHSGDSWGGSNFTTQIEVFERGK